MSLAATGANANAALTVTGGILLAACDVAGQLTVTAGGAINQLPGLASSGNDGVLNATGGAAFTAAGTGATITLTNADNDFGGASVSLSAPGAVVLTDDDANALTLGPVTFGGTLSIIAAAEVASDGATHRRRVDFHRR